MNEKVCRRIIAILSIIAVAGIAGTCYYARRSSINVNAYRELVRLNKWIDQTRDGVEQIKRNLDRIVTEQHGYIGTLEENNRQLSGNIDLLIDNNRRDRAELRRSREHIDGLESNNRELKRNIEELKTIILGIAARQGYKVDGSDSP